MRAEVNKIPYGGKQQREQAICNDSFLYSCDWHRESLMIWQTFFYSSLTHLTFVYNQLFVFPFTHESLIIFCCSHQGVIVHLFICLTGNSFTSRERKRGRNTSASVFFNRFHFWWTSQKWRVSISFLLTLTRALVTGTRAYFYFFNEFIKAFFHFAAAFKAFPISSRIHENAKGSKEFPSPLPFVLFNFCNDKFFLFSHEHIFLISQVVLKINFY